LGATAVTIQANEVYSALERGLLDCAITASSFGNNLKWTEVTDAYIDVSMGMAITGHIMSLNKWNSLDDHQKLVMETAFRELENTLWRYSLDMKDDANRCNSGLDPCANHTKYDLRYVSVSDEDVAKLRNLAQTVTVPSWEASCAQVLGDDCKSVWNEHIARHAGFAIGN
jgi:TRAP-type mannitol/chloroaromatic compound transport system substrate-binding protein